MEAGDLDIEHVGINADVSTDFTYNGNGDVLTIVKTWVDTQANKTHTWTKTFSYTGAVLNSVSKWVHVIS